MIREVFEETGLHVTHVRFALVQDSIYSSEFYDKNHFVMHEYVVRLAPESSKDHVVLNDGDSLYMGEA